MSADGEGILRRWSRRKQAARTKPGEHASSLVGRTEVPQASENSGSASGDPGNDPAPPFERFPPHPGNPAKMGKIHPADDLPDLATLTAQSDFRPFLRPGVPDTVQQAALRMLWRSDPVFSTSDGLTDYGEDMRASGIVSRIVKTAYRVGTGYASATADAEQKGEAKPDESAVVSPADLAEAGSRGTTDGNGGTEPEQAGDAAPPATAMQPPESEPG